MPQARTCRYSVVGTACVGFSSVKRRRRRYEAQPLLDPARHARPAPPCVMLIENNVRVLGSMLPALGKRIDAKDGAVGTDSKIMAGQSGAPKAATYQYEE